MKVMTGTVLTLLLIALKSQYVVAQQPELRGIVDVQAFGAVGDGITDDTASFQRAMDEVAKAGGGIVRVPSGEYLIKSHLNIPEDVTLQGVWRAPQRGGDIALERGRQNPGTLLLAVEGKGEPEGVPFIRLNSGSTIEGVTIYYPEQVKANPPLEYPWTIATRSASDNCSVINVTIINPYRAVDFGTYPTGRHYIRGLYADALRTGLYINQCYDVGRVEDVHFWPFFDLSPESPLWVYKREHGVAFVIGRTDGEMMNNCFSFGYSVGMHFIAGPILSATRQEPDRYEPGAGMFTNCYMDVTPCAVRVDAAMPNAGLSFVNSSFMSGIHVSHQNTGPVKFTGCGFWALRGLDSHAKLEGRGTVIFDSCHFSNWDQGRTGAPCINANNRRVIVTACDFDTTREGHVKVSLGPQVRSAVITSNSMPRGVLIDNKAPKYADIQIALNSSEPKPSFVNRWLLLGPFPNPKRATVNKGEHERAGYDEDFLESLGGESAAKLTRETEVQLKQAGSDAKVLKTRVYESNDQDGLVNLRRFFGQGDAVAYAFTYLVSEKAQDVSIEFGSNDCAKVWVNGEKVHEYWSLLGGDSRPGAYRFHASVKEGLNPILVKVEDAGGRLWEFRFEVYDEEGYPMKTILSPEENVLPASGEAQDQSKG